MILPTAAYVIYVILTLPLKNHNHPSPSPTVSVDVYVLCFLCEKSLFNGINLFGGSKNNKFNTNFLHSIAIVVVIVVIAARL